MTAKTHFLHVFSTFAAGGPQVRTADLMNAGADAFRHTVVAMDRCFDCRERVDPAVELTLLDPPPRASSWRTVRAMRELVRQVDPDLVLTYNWGAIETIPAARLAGCPLVHAEDGFGPDEAQRLKTRRNLTRRLVFRWARQVVVPSRNLESIATGPWRCPAEKVLYIPNGVDTGRFHPGKESELRVAAGIPAGALVVGTVAKLRAEKGLEFLIEACADLRRDDLWLLLVGDGPEEGTLRQVAVARGLADRVIFTGALPDPAPSYRNMNLFALSSHTEQMPISVLEAMASGLAVLSPDVGDVRRMVADPDRGSIVRRSAGPYQKALRRLLDDAALRKELGKANRLRCLELFQRARMIERYQELYRQHARA
jgi:glycosyltransferase involved in cell wall biosynthesis